MKSYIDELYKNLRHEFYTAHCQIISKRPPGRGSSGVLLHLVKQIAVLVQLATLLDDVMSISKTHELEKQVDFLVSVLKSATTFSQQQINDFKQLLFTVSVHINANNPRENQWLDQHIKEMAIDMTLPLHELKSHWLMCMTCGKLMFGLKSEFSQCSSKVCDAMLTKPVFVFSK